MLNNILQKIGLSEKEARIYLATLELGSSVASDIAEKAKLNRVTTYDILEKLVQKGFINFHTRQKKKYFSPTDPDIVATEIKRRTNNLIKALPEFRRLHGNIKHPSIQYFEGLNGIKTIYTDTLTSKTEILNYANSEEVRKHWPNYDEDYVEKRVKKKIYLRGIAPFDEIGLKVREENKKYYRDIRLVPAEECSFTNEIHIYDNKVAIISFKDELIGMIIESHEITNTQRAIFKMAWEFAGHFLMPVHMQPSLLTHEESV
jgi:sugar-specific transcriptional regulator TrmB